MKKYLILAVLALSWSFAARAAITALNIYTTNQGVITIPLASEPKLVFNDDRSLTVETPSQKGSEPIRVYFDEIDKCDYTSDDDTDGVSTIAANQPSNVTVTFTPTQVIFGNLPEDAVMEAYDINGRLALKHKSSGGSAVLDRTMLQRGIYIVRIGSFVTKVSL